ncbi:MAG TPA: DUF2997 domain-containing protein [Syntrophobacteraceae bacterium]|jgi:hypothetical protein|nr:DUF2997 domain-containing protein [Syntrophobacteraceae bacterium]
MKQIIIDITNEGEVKIETRGFRGKACLAESQFLKDVLGEETARQLTPAYYQRQDSKQVVKRHLPLCG